MCYFSWTQSEGLAASNSAETNEISQPNKQRPLPQRNALNGSPSTNAFRVPDLRSKGDSVLPGDNK